MVLFELSNLIKVTHQQDMVVGDMVKFVIPSKAKAETRVTRDLFESLFGRHNLPEFWQKSMGGFSGMAFRTHGGTAPASGVEGLGLEGVP